jgi:hypothetical protein
MKVTAIKRGFIHGVFRKPGDKFECTKKEFSTAWMSEGESKSKDIDNSKVKKGEDVKRESLEIPSLLNKDDKPVEKKATEEKKEAKPKKKKSKKSTKKAD